MKLKALCYPDEKHTNLCCQCWLPMPRTPKIKRQCTRGSRPPVVGSGTEPVQSTDTRPLAAKSLDAKPVPAQRKSCCGGDKTPTRVIKPTEHVERPDTPW
jgi:hypothetical protein